MDEVLELCRRVLGDGDPAEQAAAAAHIRPTSDRLELLTVAAGECRARADAENGSPAEIPAGNTAPGLAPAVARELAAATQRLPERQREVLALRELLRLSYEQIARVMDVDVTAIAPLLARSRLRLRAERRGSGMPGAATCHEHDRALRILACRQDSEPLTREDDEWLLAHLASCSECGMAHAAMLEASVCYRAWP